MPKLDRIQLDPRQPVTGEQANRLQENIERALGGLSSSFTETIRIVSGGGGDASLAGLTPLDLGQHMLESDTGTEEVVRQWQIQTGSYGSKFKLGLLALCFSAAGAVFRLRLGGTAWSADGAVALALTLPASAFIGRVVTSLGSSPGGAQLLKLTIQSAAPSSSARIKDGYAGYAAQGS